MKLVGAFVFASTIAAVFGAALRPGQQPQDDFLERQYQELERFLRDRRSSYPSAYYAPSPCAAPPIGLSPYHVPSPVHAPLYAPPISPYGLSIPQYRDADENEMMMLSDVDPMEEQMMAQQAMFEQQHFGHMPMARYSYGPAPVAAIPAIAPAYAAAAAPAAAASAAAAAAAGPAIGIFPNANVGGCSVPLLLSCSPSIRPGHIVKSHGYASYGGEAYRGVSEAGHDGHEGHDAHDATQHEHVHVHDVTSTNVPLNQ